MKILLLATYELGRQPFGLASPAAWLRKRGHTVHCCDLSRQALDETTLREAGLIAFYLPMHTATRLALRWLPAIREKNSTAHLCAYGLYGPLNEAHLRAAGFITVLGPEFESDLARVADDPATASAPPALPATNNLLPRLAFEVPDRRALAPLRKYAHLVFCDGQHRIVGYTEASRGCKHLCRHCPIVPVYSGQFRVVPVDTVLADVRQQITAGAQHITFGDPDFFNGITHALRVVEAFHAEHPAISYDATIKIEHLLRHADAIPALVRTGCLFVTSAVESLDDEVLHKLQKGHTSADFFRALDLCRAAGLALQPTFVPFTPWTTRETYLDLLRTIVERDLVSSVPPIQLAIRLLIPSRSRLLELADIASIVDTFDSEKLVYPWKHPDPVIDSLAGEVSALVAHADKAGDSRAATFEKIWESAAPLDGPTPRFLRPGPPQPAPFLSEPWYC